MSWLRLVPLLFFALSAQGAEPDSLLDFELRSLSAPERHSLKRYQGSTVLMMFFEPDCGWCFRQFKVLEKLQSECQGSIQTVAVGINGSRRELLEEYRKINPSMPTYQANQRLLRAVGGVAATPLTLVTDEQGQPLGWLRGYVPGEKLRPMLQTQLGASCST